MAVKASEFRRSLVLHWKVKPPESKPKGQGGQRGRIAGLSAKSSRRLVFALLNSPRDFGVMATLTFRERVADGQKVMKRFLRLMRESGYGGLHYAWVREYQSRGAVHYHYLLEKECLTARGLLSPDSLREVKRKKAVRKVVGGKLEADIVRSWTRAVVDESQEFTAFQEGGIVELLEDGDSAARYFGSYLAKPDQKTLPTDADVSGRWWFICPEAKPKRLGKGYVTHWPFAKPFSVLFDKRKLHDPASIVDLKKNLPTRHPRKA